MKGHSCYNNVFFYQKICSHDVMFLSSLSLSVYLSIIQEPPFPVSVVSTAVTCFSSSSSSSSSSFSFVFIFLFLNDSPRGRSVWVVCGSPCRFCHKRFKDVSVASVFRIAEMKWLLSIKHFTKLHKENIKLEPIWHQLAWLAGLHLMKVALVWARPCPASFRLTFISSISFQGGH